MKEKYYVLTVCIRGTIDQRPLKCDNSGGVVVLQKLILIDGNFDMNFIFTTTKDAAKLLTPNTCLGCTMKK
jgi:hypothetical protein